MTHALRSVVCRTHSYLLSARNTSITLSKPALQLRSLAYTTRHIMASSRSAHDTLPAGAIDQGDWDTLGGHLASFDEQREGIIKKCRDITKLSKQAIYSLHREDAPAADKLLSEAEQSAKDLLPILRQYPVLRQVAFASAMEEYVEAIAFKVFLQQNRLVKSSELSHVEPDEYLGGVLDFTGELNRYAVIRATLRDRAAVVRSRDLVDAIMGQFLQFDLRNSSLRKKFDGLKYTLKKLENTLYELSLTDATTSGQQTS